METERQPHVRDVTRRRVFAGRIIPERRRPVAKIRDIAFRAIERLSVLRRPMQDAV
ncbi:hypothetical protein [Streptomyces canus]|uniref:hypothetical protein n=1 Tax=Streptomyces canus TaxID=58343 RepID=UPI00371E26CD